MYSGEYDPALDAVIPASLPIDVVMEWDAEVRMWYVARRDAETGLFEGDVKTIRPDTGYFIRATSAATLRWNQAQPVPASFQEPTATQKGLNLIPVLHGSRPMPLAVAADDYLEGVKNITYGRLGVSTHRALEEAVTALEGGFETRLAPSGLQACTASILAFVSAGEDRCGASLWSC